MFERTRKRTYIHGSGAVERQQLTGAPVDGGNKALQTASDEYCKKNHNDFDASTGVTGLIQDTYASIAILLSRSVRN